MDLSVGHANFLCIFQFLVYVLVEQALWCLIFKYQWIRERIIKPLEGRQTGTKKKGMLEKSETMQMAE